MGLGQKANHPTKFNNPLGPTAENVARWANLASWFGDIEASTAELIVER